MGSSSRYAFFELLIEAGFISDNPTLREKMLRNVQDRESKLVGLLLTAGVSLNVGPRNALKLAVTQMDLEMLDILTHETFRIAAEALDWIPPNATEQGVLKILGKLSALGLDGEPLNRRLICAVRCRHIREATELVRMGASVDYKQASALQAAIRNSDAAMLDTLLRAACTPKVLSRVVPALVKVRPPQKRLALLEKVLSKSTVPETLGGPLEMLLAEGDEADLECIALLLRYGASPDASDEESTNSVLVAAHHGWLHVLKLLCEASIRPLVLAKAVLVAFRQFSAADNDHDSSLETMRLLLSKGAKGAPVDQALLSAVIQDSRRSILDLLLTSGASANFKQGEAFYKALTNRSSRTFEVLCKTCPPNLTSTQRLMPLAIHQQYYVLSSLNTLLECTQHKRAALDTINGGECKFLRLAVLAVDISLLRDMLALKPSALSLQLAFGATARINKRRTRLDVMKLLLEQASGTEIGQTICIADQTQLAIDGDFEGLHLVLQHGASINHQGGIAVQKAAVSGHLEVLRLLLKHRPYIETVTKACLACLKSFQKGSDFSPDHVNTIYESLLNASAGTDNSLLSNLLQASVQSVPRDVQFPALLLRRGAKVHEQTTKAALEAGSDDLLHLIIRKTSGKELFHLASACEMSAGRRIWILDECLKQDVSQVDKSRALLHSLSAKRIHDLSAADCLLRHGADISFEDGEAFKLAIRAQSAEAIKILGKRLNTRKVANNAFAYASKATFSDTRARFEIYRVLLEGNLVDKSNCYAALKNCFDRQGGDFDTIRLLVTKGADPYAASFILTLCTGTTKQFRELCKSVDLNRAVDAVLSTFHDEADAARWFKLCLRERPSSAQITKADLLTRCIKKYPDGQVLAGLILAKSNLASQTVLCSVFPGCAEEKCSVLIWALLCRPRVSNKTVLDLLGAGCDIDFATPVTVLSASMACVLDKNRTQILEALLEIRPGLAFDNHVPASVLACLGARSGSASKDPINEIGTLTLCQASIYLGNIDAYDLLMNNSVSDEDDLHLAAWLALPKFVGKLLETHNSNLESEAYSNYTPLAVALETDSGQSCCKVADTEAPFEVRRKETIELLAKKSAFTWRHRQRTYVHIALSKGPETTKILLDILDMKNNPWRFTMLVYEDKAGRRYTPYEYVTELMNIQPSEREGLLRCLAAGNLLTTLELAASGGR
ncbi:hypothetical protein CB0940_08105 [Cercospora beticola]|uniref:Uncharacterized protein n=1 Tax=Cercospora beticola TaxID=122368 RepID=A0A2G5HPH0_CERBT|nr:hypothetical protein CB0940_08105 [Cercospora beticola]PIA94451.1 hypothetical protein CB0940_08105 [Cercospora beticola]WPB04671.1 hypothetical protein RHO25_009317 [Cercospora beticola]